MFWLRSSICHVLPPLSERYSALSGGTASMTAYPMSGFDGATATATRPHDFGGSPEPAATVRSVHVAPPSVVLKRLDALGAVALSPPERNVQPRRRKPHMPAYSVPGRHGSIASIAQPAEAFVPFSTSLHVLPPSFGLSTP